MQILPAKQASFIDLFLSSQDRDYENAASFGEELVRAAQSGAGKGKAPSVRAAQSGAGKGKAPSGRAAQSGADEDEAPSPQVALTDAPIEKPSPLSHAPYSRNTKDGVIYTMDEVCFTKQELSELHSKLERAGAPAETLHGLAALVQQPDGAMLGQVMVSLHPAITPPALSEHEENNILSFLNKIDATGALGGKALPLLREGDAKEAWKEISHAFAQLPSDDAVSIERSEIAALGKGMGLSSTARQQLMGNFGSHESLALSPAGIDEFMTPVQHEMLRNERNRKKLDKALETTLQPLLAGARKRMELEKSAGERSSRRTEQSKVVIESKAMRNVDATLNNTHQAMGEAPEPNAAHDRPEKAARANEAGDSRTRRDARTAQPQAETPQNSPPPRNATDSDAARAAFSAREQRLHENEKTSDAGKRGDKNNENAADKRHGREQPPQRAEARQDAASGGNLEFGTAAAASAMSMTVAQHETTLPAHKAAPREFLFQQVEQAVLTAMPGGAKTLEIQLDPAELGALTLTLTSRNGEVSALIRSERGETADMLARQLDVLRTNLEQQGIKVDKLEVRNQGADNNAPQQWDSAQQHNARQEEYARRDTLERLRALGRVRNNELNSSDQHMEQAVHSGMRTAGNAAQHIHIIA